MEIANKLEQGLQLDAFVHRFEAAWHEGNSPQAIDDFLPDDNPLRLAVLTELVHIDMERRLMAGLPASAEDYLRRYPELVADPEIARQLLLAENALRQPKEANSGRKSGADSNRTVDHVLSPPGHIAKDELTPPFVLGPYHVVAKLDKGGMGVVFRAVHEHLQRQVALKILPPESMTDPDAVARFRREMVAIGRLDHHNIVRATDAGEAGGLHFLAMDLVEGIDLAKLVKLHGPLAVPEACALVCQAAAGLQCAHEHGLVHRDIKPSNLLLSAKGELKILDLGLALLHHGDTGSSALTASGQAMGTYDYMAPEQWESSHKVDIRADIYSLGCTLYTLLIGRPPFSGPEYGSAPRKMAAHLGEPVKPVMEQRPDVPAAVEKLLQRMVAKNVDSRPAIPAEVAEALEPFGQGADLAQLARQVIVRRDAKAFEKLSQETPPGDAVTVSRASTDGKSTATPPSTYKNLRKVRRKLVVAGFLGLTALIVVLIVQPWTGNGSAPGTGGELDGKKTLAPGLAQAAAPFDNFAVGQWHDLLKRPPIELIWGEKRSGSEWKYDSDQKSIWASCDDPGMLQLGKAPDGSGYELELEIYQRSWGGAVGLFFRGRDDNSAQRPRIHADALLVVCPTDQGPTLMRCEVDAFPSLQKISVAPRQRVPFLRPEPVKNRLKIVVRSGGLKSAFWNDRPLDSKIYIPDPNPRPGTEGSFGIYLTNTSATIYLSRLLIHP